MNWSDLSEKDKIAIQREYESGNEPGDVAVKYGLKPKQVSDQAYRKNWAKAEGKVTKNKSAKTKTMKKVAKKKTAKKVAKKKTAKKVAKKVAKKKTATK